MNTMQIEVTPLSDQGDARVAVVGDLNGESGRLARRQLARVIDSGAVNLMIDLDQVGTIDSGGLAALIVTLRRARDKGGDVRVRTSRPHIRRLMELTGLSRVFRMPAADRSATEVAA